jgi:vacuolar-type H+-ATPase subunit F/Vma7
MALLHYVGDEIGAAGWRLAGAQVHVPARGAETAALTQALAQAQLVLLSADVAQRVESATLQQAATALTPLLLVLPDTQGRTAAPALAARLRLQLGMEP